MELQGTFFLFAASCRSNESSYMSNYIPFVGRPGDWLEELQDHDWSGSDDMRDAAGAAHDDQKDDIDHDDQHPAWGERQFGGASVEEPRNPIPTVYNLTQNYPNPFNPITEIEYALPERCHVKVEIYSVLGDRVTILVNEQQNGGSKIVHWDGSNEDGVKVPGGVYFYRLTAGDYSEIKKMTLIR